MVGGSKKEVLLRREVQVILGRAARPLQPEDG
jgi:hypothetical protein